MVRERESDKRRRLAVGMATLRTLVAPSEELPIASQRAFALVALGGCWCRSTSGSTSAERPEQVRHRRPQDQRQGEDLPFNDECERTPLLNHPSFATIAVARPLEKMGKAAK